MTTTTPAALPPTSAVVSGAPVARGDRARMIANEVAKGLRLLWNYRATLIPTLLSMTLTYVMVQYFVGGGRILDELVAETAPGMFTYVVTYLTIMRMVSGILEERNAGTLEQIHLSPLSIGQLAAGRLTAALTEALLIAGVVTIGMLIALGVTYSLHPAALVPLVLIVAGASGFALLIAAASFTFPGIGALVHIIQMALIVLNGTVVPVEVYPGWLELIAKLAPGTLGIGLTREILVDGASPASVLTSGTFAWLLLYTVVLVTAGWFAYQWQVRRALRDGRLGPT